MIQHVKSVAEEEKTTVPFLLGSVLHQIFYHTDKQVISIAKMLTDHHTIPIEKISVEAASNIKNYNNLGQEISGQEISGKFELPKQLDVKFIPPGKK